MKVLRKINKLKNAFFDKIETYFTTVIRSKNEYSHIFFKCYIKYRKDSLTGMPKFWHSSLNESSLILHEPNLC